MFVFLFFDTFGKSIRKKDMKVPTQPSRSFLVKIYRIHVPYAVMTVGIIYNSTNFGVKSPQFS